VKDSTVIAIFIFVGLLAAACYIAWPYLWDSSRAELMSNGHPFKITLFSGGREVKIWHSTGKVTTLKNSDGWEFKDKATGMFVRVTGACSVE
jgi:hypothetical protein